MAILIPNIHGDFCAEGIVAGKPEKGHWGESPRYFVSVDNVCLLDPPVPIEVVRQSFPAWGWARYASSFSSVPEAIDADFWRLLDAPPVGIDNAEPPERVDAFVSRIIRDTASARNLKAKYDFQCQVCGITLPYGSGDSYIEVHHLRPLGNPHDGPDVESNMLVLCPNHHALFDLGVPTFKNEQTLEINGEMYPLTTRHRIAKTNIAYHMAHIRRDRG